MKLIYIANIRLPTEKAHGIQIMQMCQSFAQCDANIQTHTNDANKIEVELVVPRRFNPIKQDSFEYYKVKRSFGITKITSLDLIKFGKIGFWIQSFSFAKLAAFLVLFKKADIIYSRDELPLFYLSFFGKKNLFWESHSGKKNFIIKKVLEKCGGIITITQGLKNFYVKEYGINPDKILVAPDGVDLNKFEIRSTKSEIRNKLNLPENKKIIAYTGSFYLYNWKGVDVLLEGTKYFEKDWLLLLVGGNKKEIDEIKKKYVLDNILLIENKPHSEIPYYLKAADVLVLPNKRGDEMSERDTSPLKLFEYMAGRRPIVAADLPSIREILNKDSALFFEANNPVDLAEKINSLIDNPDLGRKVTDNAFQVVSNYTWDKRAQTIINFILYQNI